MFVTSKHVLQIKKCRNLLKITICFLLSRSFGYYKEARGSFFGRGVEVLKLQSRIEDQLRSPSYYIMIST